MAGARDRLAELYDGLRDAMADVRHRVVEEPAYGRIVTPEEPQQRDALADLYGRILPSGLEKEQELEIERD